MIKVKKKMFSFEYSFLYAQFLFILFTCFLYQRDGLHYTTAAVSLFCSIFYWLLYWKGEYLKIPSMGILYILWGILIAVSSLCGFYFYPYNGYNYLTYYAYSTMWIHSSLMLYVFIKRNPDAFSLVKHFYILFFIVGVYMNHHTYQLLRNVIGFDSQYNAFYFVVTPLPFLLLSKKKIHIMLALMFTTLCVVFSLKRSGFIIVAFLFLWFVVFLLFLDSRMKHRMWRKLLMLLPVCLALYILIWINGDMVDYIIRRINHIGVDGGSGRDDLFKYALDLLDRMPFECYIFGNGFGSFHEVTKSYSSSHNDWLEIMFSYGISGILLFICMHILILRNIFILLRNKSYYLFSYVAAYFTFGVFNLVSSMIYYQFYSIPLLSYFVIAESFIHKNEIKLK